MDTRELIRSIIASEEDAGDKFLESMEERISDALEVRKVELASGMMGEEVEQVDEVRQFRTPYGHSGGYNPRTGGKYKHPEQIEQDREERRKEKLKDKLKDKLKEEVEQIDELKDKTYAAVVRARSGVEDDLEHGGENWKGDNTKYKQALRRISKRRGSDEGRRLYKKYPPGKNPMANEDVEQANEAAVALPAADLNALRLMKDIDRAGTTNALRMYHRGGGDINKLSMKHRQLVTDYLSKAGGLGKVSRGAMASALRTKKEQDTEE